MRAHVIDTTTEKIVNTIEVKDMAFAAGPELRLETPVGNEGIGWDWNGGKPVDNRPVPTPKQDLTRAEKVDRLLEEKDLTRDDFIDELGLQRTATRT